MRIAVNVRFLLPSKLEGLGWYTYELCRRWVAAHPEDEFLFLFDRPYDPSFVFGPNVEPVVVFPPARHPLLWYLWFEWSLPLVLHRWKPDVFFSPDGYLSLRANVPTIMVLHDLAYRHYPGQIPFWPRRFYEYYIPRYLKRADRVVTVSNFVGLDIQRQFGIDPQKIAIVPNGCRPGFRPLSNAEKAAARAKYAQGYPYFFYVGALHPRKNIPRLIRAYDLFRSKSSATVRLVIGGRMAWQTGEINDAWSQARFKDDIHFIGYIPETALPVVLGGAFALTYVSLFEGFGLPVLEAMNSEVPVITSNLASMPEVAGDAAMLVDPFSESNIAEAMLNLWENPALQAQLIAKGVAQRTRFSWDNAANSLYELLREVSAK